MVTGAGAGIGRTIASTFADEGALVIAVDRDEKGLRKTADSIERASGTVRYHAVDVCDVRAVGDMVERTVAEFDTVDVLVNNAGVAANGPIDGLSTDIWQRNLDVNLTAVLRMCQAVIPTMKRQGRGRILNAASFAALTPIAGGVAYAAAKAAVCQFSRGLAGELGPFDITVNAYAPGMVPTTLNGFADLPDAQQQRLLDTLSLRRWGDPLDVARLLCFLASDLAGYITGTVIDVSGGKLATQIPALPYEWQHADEASLG